MPLNLDFQKAIQNVGTHLYPNVAKTNLLRQQLKQQQQTNDMNAKLDRIRAAGGVDTPAGRALLEDLFASEPSLQKLRERAGGISSGGAFGEPSKNATGGMFQKIPNPQEKYKQEKEYQDLIAGKKTEILEGGEEGKIGVDYYSKLIAKNPLAQERLAEQVAKAERIKDAWLKDMDSSGIATVETAPTQQTALPQTSNERTNFDSVVKSYKAGNKQSKITAMGIKAKYPKSSKLISSFGKGKESDSILEAISNGYPDEKIAEYFQGKR